MTKKVALLAFLVFWLFTGLSGVHAQSFRSAASGDLLYGDFDNDLDPIYIWENQGYRAYTILSNLSSWNDRFIANSNNGIYLFGISGSFGLPQFGDWRSRTMFLIQLADSRGDANSGLDTDFDGVVDIGGEGYMSGDLVQYFDINDDNIFDTRANYSATADNYDILKRRDWNVVHSYGRGETSLGFKFSHLGFGNNYSESNRHADLFEVVTPAHTYSYSNMLSQTDLSNLTVLERRREKGEFLTTYATPSNIFQVALDMPFDMLTDSDIRFDIALELPEDNYLVNDRFDYFRDVSSGAAVDINEISESVNVDSSLGGYFVRPMVRLTKHWSPRTYSWFDLAFGTGKFDADKSFADIYAAQRQLTNPGGNVMVITNGYEETIGQTGDTGRKFIGFYHKTVAALTEKFTFSAGLRFGYLSDKTDWDADYMTVLSGAYDDGNQVSDHADSSYTQTSAMAANLIATTKTTTIDLPVAMEYALGRWTFRLGAIHQIARQIDREDFVVTESAPMVTTIIYGDGDTTITVEDNEYLSQGSARETQDSNTNFVYGLELKANEHLKVELLGFMDTANVDVLNTNFYRQLRMSLTVLF